MVLLAPTVDGRAAIEFEHKVTAELDAGLRLFVIDCSQVTLLTSQGIRVLLLLAKRTLPDGGIALSSVSDRIRTLLDIAGLTRQFTIVGTRAEALAHLRRPRPKALAPRPQSSGVSRLLLRLLGGGHAEAAGAAAEAGPAGASKLAARIRDLLRTGGPHQQ